MIKAQPHSQRRVPARKRAGVKSLPDLEGGNSEVVLYEAPGGEVQLDVRLDRDTVWLTQAQMADLFGRERSVVTTSTFEMRLLRGSLIRRQHVQNLHKFNKRATGQSHAMLSITTSTSSSRLVIASSRLRVRAFGSGPLAYCASI